MPAPENPIVESSTVDAWEAWLEQNHDSADGVWLKLAKKSAPRPSAPYSEWLDTAICFGWIDGQRRPFDQHFYLQRFTPRRPRSKWSQVNREKAQRLIAEDRMRPAGRRQVEAAKQDGRWDNAYPPQSRITVPEDLQRELDRNPDAKAFFATLDSQNRYAFLYRLHEVTSPAKRAQRIANYIEMLSAGKTFY